jgi:hypothetical protein
MQAVPSSGKTNSPAELFYKGSFRTKLPTLADFYDPLETARGAGRGEARQSGTKKQGEAGRKEKERKKRNCECGSLSLLFSFQIYIPPHDINTILSQVLGTVRNGVGH